MHVVVDKPVAVTADDARRLAEAARARDRLVIPYHNRRWDGDFRTLRTLLRQGAIGQPTRFESRFERWRPVPRPGWRQLGDPAEAGGILYDLGSHLIDQAIALFGRVTHVYAELDSRTPGAEVDEDAFVALAHSSGMRSHLWMNAKAANPGPRLRLLGTSGAYVKHDPDVQEVALRDGRRPGQAGWGEDPPERWGVLTDGTTARQVKTEPGAYHGFYQEAAHAIGHGAAPPVDIEDAIAGLAIIEGARRSARDGCVVMLDTLGAG